MGQIESCCCRLKQAALTEREEKSYIDRESTTREDLECSRQSPEEFFSPRELEDAGPGGAFFHQEPRVVARSVEVISSRPGSGRLGSGNGWTGSTGWLGSRPRKEYSEAKSSTLSDESSTHVPSSGAPEFPPYTIRSMAELRQEFRRHLTLLGVQNEPAVETMTRVWCNWYREKARQYYRQTLSLLRMGSTSSWWTEIAHNKVPPRDGVKAKDDFPSIEESLFLYRYCLARQLHESEIVKMMAEDLKWRETQFVEHIAFDPVYTSEAFRRELCAFYPHGYYGTDREGRPVYYDCIGEMRSRDLKERFTHAQIVEYWISSYENLLRRILPACSIAAGRRVTQGVTVLDLHGISMSEFTRSRELLHTLLAIGQLHYPECMHRTLIIRSSWGFRAIWKLIKPLLSEDTVRKVKIVEAGRELAALSEVIDPAQMPRFVRELGAPDAREWCTAPVGPWCGSACAALVAAHVNVKDVQL